MLRSLEDVELRKLAKRANQRLVRLEKWQSEHGTGFTPAYEQAMFYLSGKKGLLRFKEDPSKLSADEKAELRFKVTAFLNNPLSERKGLNQREKIRQQIKAGIGEEEKGLLAKLGLQQPTADNEKKFWTLFDKAKSIGLTKAFDYKTIANILSWKMAGQQPNVFRRLAEWMLNLNDLESLSRPELIRQVEDV